MPPRTKRNLYLQNYDREKYGRSQGFGVGVPSLLAINRLRYKGLQLDSSTNLYWNDKGGYTWRLVIKRDSNYKLKPVYWELAGT